MPSGDIADAVVETARSTLTKVIDYINNQKEWNAKVVYGGINL